MNIKIGEQTHFWAKERKIAVSYLDIVDSTNLWAKNEAFHKSLMEIPFKIYLSDLQTAGRGRGQNRWNTEEPGHQLLTTWSLLNPEVPSPTLSPKLGLAVWRSCQSTWSFLNWSLKAPNDIYLNDKKIAGLLLENLIQGELVRTLFGLGMNIISHPHEVTNSTSLCEVLPEEAPLLAEDWFQFLDRLSLEFSMAIENSPDPLNTTEREELLWALNKWPLLKTKYTKMDPQGHLYQGQKIISWTEL